jgi:hypothetical protein
LVDAAAALDAAALVDEAFDSAGAELLDAVFDPEPQPASITLAARAATPTAGTVAARTFIERTSLSRFP